MSEHVLSPDDTTLEDEIVSEGGWSLKDGLAPVITFILLLLIWEGCTRYFAIPSWLLPSPYEIGKSFLEWYDDLWRHSVVTLYETLAGFALSIVIAVPLAVLVVYSPFLRKSIYPLLLGLQSVPKVAIAPLLALWIGFGMLPKIVVVFLVCFVIVDKHQRSPSFPNVFAVGVCVAIAPVGATPVPVGVPKTGFMIESMVTATAMNIGALLHGKQPTAIPTWNAICLADFGDSGVAFLAQPQIPPRNVNWSSKGEWVHYAKVGFEKYFLRKMRRGESEPFYERFVLDKLNIAKIKQVRTGT